VIGIIGNARKDGQSSFGTLIKYCAKDDRAAYIGMQNIHFRESAAEEMESLAFENPRCKDPLMHIILSWREMELPTNEQVDEAVKITLRELDLQNCQAVWIVHADTENRHVHIAANRIDPETHRAIRPAGGWTHKAIQRAARKIEIAQGWSLESHGTYVVNETGELKEKNNPEPENPKLSKTALDIEAHVAEKSAERISQESAAPIIRTAKSWEELHEWLADQGIAFEKKGSGAVLVIDGVVVKASKAGRDISLSKLEARLGEYRQRRADLQVKNRQIEPVDRVNECRVKGDWERYIADRERYFKEKRVAADSLNTHQKAERATLQKKQKADRDSLFLGSWKGKGALLNRQRSILAATQQSEKLNLRDRQYKEREEMKKHFPVRFPNFKTWLDVTEDDKEAFASFRYPQNGVMAEPSKGTETAAPFDLRAFSPVMGNKGGVAYRMEDGHEAQFIDYGKLIVLSEKCDRAAILAALQLANQKWGSAVINGTEEYKRACVELAIAHNLKIYNPDLAREVEEGKKRLYESRTSRQTEEGGRGKQSEQSIFTQYADAIGAERFRILVTEFTSNGTKAFLYDRKNDGYSGKTKDETLEAMPKLSAYSRYGKNIIVTPISPDKHHILVDDLTPEKLRQLKDDGYSPACVIESSPANYQAIFTVPSVEGDSAKDREAANKLTRELNLKYGDPKLSGSIHGHRLPPFPNRKPKHKKPDGSYPESVLVESNGDVCEKTRQELETIHISLKEAEEKAKQTAETKRRVLEGRFTGANNPNGAYWVHYRDIRAKFTGPVDYSRIDAMIGTRLRATDHTQSEVQSAIENNAPAMRRENMTESEYNAKYRNRDWKRYAAETTEKFVFGVRGTVQFEKALDYRPLYMRIEGRDPSKEQTEQNNRKQSKGR
jgi:hypothetical protein